MEGFGESEGIHLKDTGGGGQIEVPAWPLSPTASGLAEKAGLKVKINMYMSPGGNRAKQNTWYCGQVSLSLDFHVALL